MNKRTWINIGLFIFIAILSAILIYPTQEAEQKLPPLTDIDIDSISRIEIIRKDLDDFFFNREDDAWYMQSPLQYKANIARINTILRVLNIESHTQLNPAEVELSRFELNDPKIQLKLNDSVFQFGNTDAIDQRRYVLFGDKIHLINDFLYAQLNVNAAFYAGTKLLPLDSKVNTIKFPDNQLSLVNDQWQMETLLDVQPEQLKRIAYNWQNAVAISAVKYVQPETESLITVTFKNSDTIEFVIISTEPYLILGRKDIGIQYHMGSDEADKLLLKENPTSVPTPATVELQ